LILDHYGPVKLNLASALAAVQLWHDFCKWMYNCKYCNLYFLCARQQWAWKLQVFTHVKNSWVLLCRFM